MALQMELLVVVVALGMEASGASAALASDSGKPPPGPAPPPPLPDFQFSPVFGDDMVLQMQPAAAAVYGFTGAGGSAVSVSVSSGGKVNTKFTGRQGWPCEFWANFTLEHCRPLTALIGILYSQILKLLGQAGLPGQTAQFGPTL
jgi:hypothetical protein